MNSKRVEELLKQYFGEVGSESLLAPDVDRRLRAKLKRLAVAEERGRFVRKAMLVAAATVLGFLSVLIYDRAMPWKAAYLVETLAVTRGDREYCHFEIQPAADGFFYLLAVDEVEGFRIIFPFLDDQGSDDFGLSGPFEKGRKIRIPPLAYHGFEISGDRTDTSFFLIPSAVERTDTQLRQLLDEAADAIGVEAKSVDRLRDDVGKWLRSRYPGAFPIDTGAHDSR